MYKYILYISILYTYIHYVCIYIYNDKRSIYLSYIAGGWNLCTDI